MPGGNGATLPRAMFRRSGHAQRSVHRAVP
jgi:hypothetical protein